MRILEIDGVAKVDDVGEGVTVVDLRQRALNHSTAKQTKTVLVAVCKDRLKRGNRRLVLDLSRVELMDSMGLTVLISVTRALARGEGHMALAGLSSAVRKLMEITSLDQVFAIHPDVASARASMTG